MIEKSKKIEPLRVKSAIWGQKRRSGRATVYGPVIPWFKSRCRLHLKRKKSEVRNRSVPIFSFSIGIRCLQRYFEIKISEMIGIIFLCVQTENSSQEFPEC